MPPRKKQKLCDGSGTSSTATVPSQTVRLTRARATDSTKGHQSKREATSIVNVPDDSRAPAGKVNRGCLKTLPDIAVEIQLEIYRYLEPRGLLYLSRTCKRFRTFFLHRPSIEKLWERARRNADDLPERPPFMSEPAFIHLLYSTYCQSCACGNVRNATWTWFARYCGKCLRELSYNYPEAEQYIAQCAKGSFLIHTFPRNYARLLPVVNASRDHSQSRAHNRMLKAHLEKMMEEWGAKPDAGYKTAWTFADERERVLAKQKEYAAACEAWYERQESHRLAGLEVARKERFQEILKRLEHEGWGKELEFLGPSGLNEMSNVPIVRQAAKLTPKVWQSVYDRLNDFLHQTRRKRLEREREALLRTRFLALEEAIRQHYVHIPRAAHMEFRPRYVDFALTPECRPLLDAPDSEVITTADFSDLVPALAKRWEAEQKEKLSSFIRELLPAELSVSEDTDVLNLAVAFFGCQCSYGREYTDVDPEDPLRYPAILGHDCMRRIGYMYKIPEDDFYACAALRDPSAPLGCSPSSIHSWRKPFHPGGANHYTRGVVAQACAVVKALGLDPSRATFDDLRNCEAIRLRCVQCTKAGRRDPSFYAYTWEAALRHANFYVGIAWKHDEWVQISDESIIQRVRELEAEAHRPSLTKAPWNKNVDWSCSLCLDVDGDGEEMQAHLKELHGITDTDQSIKDGTIYIHPFGISRWCPLKRAVQLPAPPSTSSVPS